MRLRTPLIALIVMGLTMTFMVTGIDALEYETTGKCKQCHLLPLLRPAINK